MPEFVIDHFLGIHTRSGRNGRPVGALDDVSAVWFSPGFRGRRRFDCGVLSGGFGKRGRSNPHRTHTHSFRRWTRLNAANNHKHSIGCVECGAVCFDE